MCRRLNQVKPGPIHVIQYEALSQAPYRYTQEDILFLVFAERNAISEDDTKSREAFFKKSHPCLRSSALGKRYGWGVHFDGEGKAALYSKSSKGYEKFKTDQRLKIVRALRNKRANG